MSHYNVKPIRLDFKPSKCLGILLGMAGLSALIVVVYTPLALWIKLLSGLMILAAAGYEVARHALLVLPGSCRALKVDEKGELWLFTKAGDELQATLLSSSFVASYLTVLNCRSSDDSRQRSLLILPDQVDAEAFRQLRVWLRWGHPASAAEES